MERCQKHSLAISHICTHPECLGFSPLCSECHSDHLNKHKQNHLYNEKNWIITREECLTKTQNILHGLREELEQIENKAATALMNNVNTNIDEIILEIESIRQQINKLFDKYIQSLKDKFEFKIKANIHQTYDQIQKQLSEVKSLLEQCSVLRIQQGILQTDLSYQVLYPKTRLESLIYQRANQRFQGKIDDDVALHFIGVIQKELDQLVIYEKPKVINKNQEFQAQKSQKQFEKFKTYAPHQLEQTFQKRERQEYSMHKQWLFYFEVGTKNFHFIDLKLKQMDWKTKELDNSFFISNGSRSILGPDGYIYYFHGYEDGMNDEEYKTIYQYDHLQSKLVPKSRMHTVRKNFSLCSTNDMDIYIIGGYNYKEGCLTKCEKYNVNTNSVTIINHLLELSAFHSTCSYNNQLIIKFGGLRVYIETQNCRECCKHPFQVYNIEEDTWRFFNLQKEGQYPSNTINAVSTQIPNTNQIYIFGGQMVLKSALQATQQGFKIFIEEEEEFDKTDQITSSALFIYQPNFPISSPGYYVSEPQCSQNQIHVFLRDRDISHYVYQKVWKKV